MFDIEPDDLTVYRVVRPWTIDSEKPTEPVLEPCRMYSNTIERVCALCPSDDTNPDFTTYCANRADLVCIDSD